MVAFKEKKKEYPFSDRDFQMYRFFYGLINFSQQQCRTLSGGYLHHEPYIDKYHLIFFLSKYGIYKYT